MEVDSPPAAAGVGPVNNNNDDGETNAQRSKNNKQMQEKTIKMHPLALIGISDHSTRVISGGSAQPSNSVIMGLLFGYQNHRTISIIDAEEVEYNHNKEHVDTKIELHQKVFPSHEVVGWYRVFRTGGGMDATEEEKEEMGLPTPDDMRIQNGWMRDYNESPIFVLMSSGEAEVEEDEAGTTTSQTMNEASKTTSMDIDEDVDERDARDKMDRDEQLPLSIYETLVLAEQPPPPPPPTNEQSSQPQQAARSGAIFVNLEFELETFEPERIAVEKVFKTQPTTSTTVVSMPNTTTTTVNTPTTTEDDHAPKMGPPLPPSSNTEEKDNNNNPPPPPPSASVLHIQSLQSSIEAMNARIAVLLEFLRKTQTGKLPPDHALLRQVGSLVRQLPFVLGRGDIAADTEGGSSSSSRKMRDGWRAEELEDGYEDMLVLSFLASVAKTTKAVLNYSDKFRVVNDSATKSNSHSSNRESLNLRKVL
eukprot:CAMPEP_0198276182 /NCGR_PEP_ID=MMETSP1447-20131203/65174_1 /TAXON_ID=420782 /ORGANISM="Chaetoceros dichaeta, Strain CCMP1751" /LENGTH=476 /DNA_ID=CAMNT_0043971109 /DNA_START=35 /DNA_END=1465 /DNA_ORIENTATION=+